MTQRARAAGDRAAWLLVPLTAVLVALLLIFFVFFQSIIVEGDSMLPTLRPEDRLLLTRGYDAPHRGDIVVFKLREGSREVDVVKRIVGIPGDIVMTRGDLAWVNGRPEPAGIDAIVGPSQRVIGPARVATGTVFVLGDNRVVSLDSRFIGPVKLRSILGRAVAVFSPVTRIRMLDLPR